MGDSPSAAQVRFVDHQEGGRGLWDPRASLSGQHWGNGGISVPFWKNVQNHGTLTSLVRFPDRAGLTLPETAWDSLRTDRLAASSFLFPPGPLSRASIAHTEPVVRICSVSCHAEGRAVTHMGQQCPGDIVNHPPSFWAPLVI